MITIAVCLIISGLQAFLSSDRVLSLCFSLCPRPEISTNCIQIVNTLRLLYIVSFKNQIQNLQSSYDENCNISKLISCSTSGNLIWSVDHSWIYSVADCAWRTQVTYMKVAGLTREVWRRKEGSVSNSARDHLYVTDEILVFKSWLMKHWKLFGTIGFLLRLNMIKLITCSR